MKGLAVPEASPAAATIDGDVPALKQETPADTRLRREREQIAEVEDREPLHRRILTALSKAPSTPTSLAERLRVPKESVSRRLRDMREAGLVEARRVPDDLRLREYRLTAEGESQLSRHRAFGAPEKRPPAPSSAETHESLRSAIRGAVKMRRQSNRLEDAADRFRLIVEQAEKLGAPDVALDAKAEMATTFRQARRMEEVDDLLEELDAIAESEAVESAEIALSADAHREYALGRLGDRRGEDLPARACHLKDAAALYKQLARRSGPALTTAWLERRAWSVVSVAGNLRKQSKLEDALTEAGFGLRLFEELEDPYGQSHSFFMLGFCLRLLGNLGAAWKCLNEAHELASANGYERFQADSLMQMGEVRRCQGNVEEARELLGEALAQSDRMGLLVTQAFAQSALGAVDYQLERWTDAEGALLSAQALFESCDHAEGLALNARRRATVTRQGASAASRVDLHGVERLIRSAFARYKRLRSPAGIAACEIEQGRLQMIRGGGRRSLGAVKKLKLLLENFHQRDLLEQDLWVPRVLDAFAHEIEDEDLTAQAMRVRLSAEQRLADRVAQQIPTTIGHDPHQVDEHGCVLVAEMGGETRRDAISLEPALATR